MLRDVPRQLQGGPPHRLAERGVAAQARQDFRPKHPRAESREHRALRLVSDQAFSIRSARARARWRTSAPRSDRGGCGSRT